MLTLKSIVAGIFDGIVNFFGVASGILTGFIMISVTADMIGRAVFNTPLAGGIEISVLFMIGLIFLGMPSAQKQGLHFKIEFLVNSLRGVPLLMLQVVNYLFCIFVAGTLAYFSGKLAIRSFHSGEASYGTIAFPVWPSRILISVGLTFLALQFVRDLAALLRGKGRSSPDTSSKGGF